MNDTWESNLYFIVNINFFNGSNDLSNFLKCANFILNVISTGMNDDHIRFLGSNRSDVVYNIIRMAPGWHLILTESSLETSRPFTCLFFFFWCRVHNTTVFFIIRIFIFSQFNLETVIIYRLVFPVIGRYASIDRTTLATLVNGNVCLYRKNPVRLVMINLIKTILIL